MAKFPTRTVKLKTGNILTIRAPVMEDAKSLVDYINQVSAESENLSFGKGDTPFTEEKEKQYISSLQVDPHKIMAIGVIEGEIMAVSDIRAPSLPRMKHSGELGLSVVKKYWNIGVGKALLEYLIDWAKTDSNLKKINLQVKESNDSGIHLYEKMGFVEEGRISRGMYINNTFFTLIYMGLKL
jgi:RimJ/RimL family protein N-acetyltransferase